MLTLSLVLIAIAAGFAVDRFAFHGDFVRMVIAEIDYLRSGRRSDTPETNDKAPRPIVGRRRT